MFKEHRRSTERTNKQSLFEKPFVKNVATVAALATAAGIGGTIIKQQYEANATPQPEVTEQVYGINPETQEQLMQIQKQWDHDTPPMAPHEIPASVLSASGFDNFTIVEHAGGAGEQAKKAYAQLYHIPVTTLSPEINQSIDITAKTYDRVHGGDELGILEVTDSETNQKYVVVTDEIPLDTN